MIICDDNHKYWLDGKAIPGNSEIMKDVGIINLEGVPPDILEVARDKGTKVHTATELLDMGMLDGATVDRSIQGYLDAYKGFLAEYSPTIINVEKIYHTDEYACRVDRVFKIGDQIVICDIKTGGIYRATRIQTAAQKMAMGDLNALRGVVYLKSDGSYKYVTHDDDTDLHVWQKCVDIFYFNHPRYRSKKCTENEEQSKTDSWIQ